MTSRPIEVPVGLFGVQRKTMSGSTRATSAATVSASRVKTSLRSALSPLAPVPVVRAASAEPAASGAGGDQRVHRIRRRHAEHGAPGSAEGLDDMAEDLVRAVGGPDHLGLQRDAVTGTFVDGVEIGHEVFTQ